MTIAILNSSEVLQFRNRSLTITAICRAGLVFDGQLVIDPEFRTNDPSVFAAGTITKYRRKYYAECWQHKYYSSVEIGERVSRANFQRSVAQTLMRTRPFLSKAGEGAAIDRQQPSASRRQHVRAARLQSLLGPAYVSIAEDHRLRFARWLSLPSHSQARKNRAAQNRDTSQSLREFL